MNLYVIRHGETNMGKNNIIATETEPLNETGITQALEIGKEIRKLNINKIYCSPIQRAKDTLKLFKLDKNIPVIIENRIKERNMGIYENVPFSELKWDEFWNYNSDRSYPELETMKNVYERISDFLNELKLNNSNDNILLVTHGGISRAIYWYFNEIPENGNSSNINENCKIYSYKLQKYWNYIYKYTINGFGYAIKL